MLDDIPGLGNYGTGGGKLWGSCRTAVTILNWAGQTCWVDNGTKTICTPILPYVLCRGCRTPVSRHDCGPEPIAYDLVRRGSQLRYIARVHPYLEREKKQPLLDDVWLRCCYDPVHKLQVLDHASISLMGGYGCLRVRARALHSGCATAYDGCRSPLLAMKWRPYPSSN